MELDQRDRFRKMLQEMAAMYKGTFFNDFFADGYWKVLKSIPIEAIEQACLDLMGNEMRKDGMPTAAEIKSVSRRFQDRTEENIYLSCQQPGCPSMLHWPPSESGERGMFCRIHRPAFGPPATLAERIEIAKGLTPKGRAFLRSCLEDSMKDIPVTPEEAALSDGPQRQVPTMLDDYMKRIDTATAARILDNYHNRYDYREE